MKKSISLISIFLLLLGNAFSQTKDQSRVQKTHVKNIIFLIGDGMGVSHVYAAMEYSNNVLSMEKFEYSGFSKTNSLTHKITDSAAGGTAMATGKKTRNGIIGQDTTGVVFKSILEYAEENGLSTGLVSTSAITHATPASFIAHETSRNNYEAIASDFLDTDIEVFIGGGYDHFGNRKDSLNLIDSLIEKGYEVDTTMSEVMNSRADKLAGLVGRGHLPPVAKGRDNMLPDATKKALEILSKNEKGFFLMVEGSQIDWGGHANDIDYVLSETYDFDKAVGVALDFAKKNPETLIVVSSDHETGGVTLIADKDDYTNTKAHFSTGGHTSVMVPIFSYGPGAEKFSGILDNVDFFPRFMELYGFEE